MPVLSTHSSSIRDVHIAVQSSPLSIFRTFSSFQTETLHALNSNSPFIPIQAIGNHYSTLSMYLTTLGILYKWNPTTLSYCVWFISLTILFPRFIYVITEFHSFLRQNNILVHMCLCVCVCTTFHLYIHPSMDI